MVSILKKILDFSKKILIVVIAYSLIFSLFLYFNKQSLKTNTTGLIEKNRQEAYKILKNPKVKGSALLETYKFINCKAIGEMCTDNPNEAEYYQNGSFFGFLNNLTAATMTNPLASGVYSTYQSFRNAGLTSKSYAAEGIGFTMLEPFKSMWLVLRNVTFMTMIVIIVAIGFMIMFRTKINPQTVISLENALPKIVITLILITFSYAIAGFLIDIMYVSIGIVVALFNEIDPSLKIDAVKEYFIKPGTFGIFPGKSPDVFYMWAVSWNILTIIPKSIKVPLDGIIFGLFVSFLPKILSAVAPVKFGALKDANWVKSIGSSVIDKISPLLTKLGILKQTSDGVAKSGTIGASLIFALIVIVIEIIMQIFLQPLASTIILTLILYFSLVFVYFRIFFMLLSVYINTLLLIMFSPLIISLEAIPGKSTFSSWLKSIMLNLLTFPVLIVLILVSRYIMNIDSTKGPFWAPPFLGAIQLDAFKIVVGGAIVFMAPELINNFKKGLGVKPMSLDLNVGAFFAGGQAVAGGSIGLLGQFSSIGLGLKAAGIAPQDGKGLFGLFGSAGKTTAQDAISDGKPH